MYILQQVNALAQEEKGGTVESSVLDILSAEPRRKAEAEYGRRINEAYEEFAAAEKALAKKIEDRAKDLGLGPGAELSGTDTHQILLERDKMNAEFRRRSLSAKAIYDEQIDFFNARVRARRQAAEANYRDCLQRQMGARHEQPTPEEDINALRDLINLGGRRGEEEIEPIFNQLMIAALGAAIKEKQAESLHVRRAQEARKHSEREKKRARSTASHERVHEAQPEFDASAAAGAVTLGLRLLQFRRHGGTSHGPAPAPSSTCAGGVCRR